MTSNPALRCQQLSKHFGDFCAVDQLNFEVAEGSFFSILGPSGCGKTTLLRMLAGFESPSSGDIFIQQQRVNDLAPNHRPLNMVFQNLALFPTMTVGENIAYGLKRQKVAKAEQQKKIGEILERVGLPDAANKAVTQLSGGQKQRVALARCLVLQPKVLLLDEPLGALDLKLREKMKLELKQLQRDFGTTFVYITHDQSEAMVMSDKVAVMNHGRFEQVAAPVDLYLKPNTPFVARFVGNTNMLSAEVVSQHDDKVEITTLSGLRLRGHSHQQLSVGQRVQAYIRPEALHPLNDADQGNFENQIVTRLNQDIFDGANSMLLAEFEGQQLQVLLPLQQRSRISDSAGNLDGSELKLGWNAEHCLVLDDSPEPNSESSPEPNPVKSKEA